MFDRIAGVYDLMNPVMTAGLHHRWRARAADLARVGPGDARRSTSRPAPATWRSSSPARRPAATVVGSDFSEGMLDARARARRRRLRVRVGRRAGAALRRRRLRRRDGRLRRAQLLRPRRAACARWRASCGPAASVVVLEITTPTKPPLSTFFALWFDRIVPALGTVAGDSDAYAYLPSSVKRFPGARGAGGAHGARRAARRPLDPDGRRDHRPPRGTRGRG